MPPFFVEPPSTGRPCADTNPGTEKEPFCTVQKGVEACRAANWLIAGGNCSLQLFGGTHRLAKTIELGPDDSGLVISSYTSETAVISGSAGLATEWVKYQPESLPTLGKQIWVANMDTHFEGDVKTLLVDGVRAIRARYPDADPEVDKFPKGWIRSDQTDWAPPKDMGAPTYLEYAQENMTRNDFVQLFKTYRAGVGGQCSHFTPPISYWCAEHTEGGGAGQYRIPTGLKYTNQKLPHAPYRNPGGAIVHAWRPGHWSSWMFEVDKGNATHLMWTKGGFQGARGESHGAEYFIDNVFEELDSEREFFYNSKTRSLYYVTNGSKPTGNFEASFLTTLFDVRGTQQKPVKNIGFSGLTFTGTVHTYMEPHGVPSGGDWALQRSGALFFEGTADLTIKNCLLTRLDGNGIFLSGYNQRATIASNEIAWTGDSAIAAWGYTSGSLPNQPAGTGPDGTGGEFPRGTVLENNFIHHLGIHQKQSSCWFQAKTAETSIRGNLCFQIPRAGFNFNDGFGGGNVVSDNLLFNTCGESGDHGAINSWDRQPFVTTVATGKPSLVPAVNKFHHNFIVSNFDADGGAIDNDDGSSYYEEYNNFCIYGGAKMGNFDGHAKKYHGNINAYANVYGKTCFWNWPKWFPEKPYEEQYYNNTCILDASQNYIKMPGSCDFGNTSTIGVIAHDNKVYAPGMSAQVSGCGKSISFQEWEQLKLDPGTTIHDAVDTATIMGWGADMLGFTIDPMEVLV